MMVSEEKLKVINGVKHKLCSTCKTFVPVMEFSSRKASADGLAYSCKTCERDTAKKSYDRKKIKAKRQKEYLENREELIDKQKARYVENKDEILAKQKEWRQSDKGQKLVNTAAQRRRDRIKEQTPGGCDYSRNEIIERDSVNGVCICQICNQPIVEMFDMQIDHIIGIAAGGSDTADNVRCTHTVCNLKRVKDGRDM